MESLSTLCYIRRGESCLMLHRTVKKNDCNKDKWIGVGGHFEAGESPEECLLREVKEETGYTLTSYRYRGIVTFVSGDGVTEYMSLFTADGFTGEPVECDEGKLEWVPVDQIWNLNIWEGDKIFFRLIEEDAPFFSLKLVYDGKGKLVTAALNGEPLELFDILNADGTKSGVVRERGVAHREGSLHATAHVWLVRPNEKSGYDLLLQKRSRDKDSYPGCYDISAAGHVGAGEGCTETALRELSEELGIPAAEKDLEPVGVLKIFHEETFYGRPFRDAEMSHIYVCRRPVGAEEMRLQASEVEDVVWTDYRECVRMADGSGLPNCLEKEELKLLGAHLGIEEKTGKIPLDNADGPIYNIGEIE